MASFERAAPPPVRSREGGPDPPFFYESRPGDRLPGGKDGVCAVEPLEMQLRRMVGPLLADRGLELVEIAIKGATGRQVLRLDIDRAGTRGVGLADCQRVSQLLGEVLDGADLIHGRYVLEVSSPGLDRPIRSADDIRRNTGRRVVVTSRGEDGERLLHHGRLLGCHDGQLRLEGDDEDEVRIPLERVVSARQEVAF